MRPKHTHTRLKRDLLLVGLSVLATVAVVYSGALETFLSSIEGLEIIGSFIAGIFFTSLFTIAPASVVLAKIGMTSTMPLTVAFFGAIGAMLGDLVLFLFIRDRLAEDITDLIKGKQYRKIMYVFKLRIFRWLVPLLGALIIISPLPDEIGLAMMGFSRMKTKLLMPVTFIMNFLGILLIFAIARAL